MSTLSALFECWIQIRLQNDVYIDLTKTLRPINSKIRNIMVVARKEL